ncbi:hypothetical protein BH09ACT1_BH09ACT1_09050 [soil metagenome]
MVLVVSAARCGTHLAVDRTLINVMSLAPSDRHASTPVTEFLRLVENSVNSS